MAESIIQKAGGGVASDECTAGKAQVLAGYTAVTKDSGDEPAAGTMRDHTGIPSKIENRRLANGRFEVAVASGYHDCYWAGDSYEYMELSEVAATLGLTAAKLMKGQTVCGVAGTATSDANAAAGHILSGRTAYVNGVKITGSMTVSSVVSFSVAPYSTSQVLATWKNPSRGPYSGVAICAKAGGYPANINDGRGYTGVGSNSAVNGTSSQVIGGLAAGTTYYFRIWVYCTCSAGDQYSGYLQATCKVTAHGRQAFTASGTFTVPAGVRSINVHCTGGGGPGGLSDQSRDNWAKGGAGGHGGYTSYKNSIVVTPGQQINCIVGAGGKAHTNAGIDEKGNASSAALNGAIIVSAEGGMSGSKRMYGAPGGGSGGGGGSYSASYSKNAGPAGAGGSNGADGNKGAGGGGIAGVGQGATTREFGTGTLYAGGGGGGGTYYTNVDNYPGAAGGAGGGGAGGTNGDAASGTAGTGGGGGGAYTTDNASRAKIPGSGGSGNVIITW